jgi:hypothetical protein
MQVLAAESVPVRKGLIRHLAELPSPEATRALAKLAVFSPEPEVSQLAAHALKGREARDYDATLLGGLRYPWPAVARNAADALVLLERTDLAPVLVEMLDQPDPRLPVTRTVNGHEVTEVKQLVRLNHNQNCLMCHPPADKNTPTSVVFAPMPVPGKPLPSFSQGYGMQKQTPSDNDIIVRVDVTYLRQDFSVMQHVPNAAPWPSTQRFDFVVRTVPVTVAQAQEFQQALQPLNGTLTPYQQTALMALRALTGKDAAPTAQAWQDLLKQKG